MPLPHEVIQKEIEERRNRVHNPTFCVCCDNLRRLAELDNTTSLALIESIEKMVEGMIEENDDGMWSGRETADRFLSFIQQEKEKITNLMK